jgi:hypothetical protein
MVAGNSPLYSDTADFGEWGAFEFGTPAAVRAVWGFVMMLAKTAQSWVKVARRPAE